VRIAHRLGQNPATPLYYGATRIGLGGRIEWTGRQRWLIDEQYWREAVDKRLSKLRPGSVVFVGSMADVFFQPTPYEWGRLGAMMYLEPHVEFVLVSKRLANLKQFAELTARHASGPLPNVTGVATCCTQAEADRNIPLLLAAPFARRGVCLEPLLEPVRLARIDAGDAIYYPLAGQVAIEGRGMADAARLDWVVTGCESGPCRRPAEANWFRALRAETAAAGVPFMLKQMEVDGYVRDMPALDGKVSGQTPWGVRP
jgi:protein gp37